MLPNNVVSFMKKMVKNADSGQQENSMAGANKLTRLKQTLTTGLQQAQDSVAKFSPKSIHVGVGDITSRRLSSKEPSNEEPTNATDNVLDKDASNPTNPPSALLNSSVGTSSKSCSGPPNRLTSCRVCVRSLSIGNSDVSYRLCSQCNLKVCEDCASYSNLDNDIDKTFWRCSVCRRRNQGATTPMLTSTGAAGTGVTRQQPISGLAHRWSEEKPGSLSITPDDYNKRSSAQTPGSAPVHRRERRSTSGESGISCSGQDQSRHPAAVQPSLQVESSRHNYGKSIDNIHTLNGRRSRDGSLTPTPGRTTNRLDQPHETGRSVSASESSPEEMSEQQKMQQYERDSGAGSSISRRSANDIHFGDSSSSRRSSCRRSFQKQMRDQSVYLSADDACLSRWSQQRRYSSESSDASDTSGASGTPRRPSQEESDEVGGGYGSSLLPSTRRRLSFRSNRTRHFYDADGSEGYDGDELSADGGTSLTTDVGVNRSSRRSCSDISQLNNSNELAAAVTAASVGSQHGLHSPRGSINYDGVNDERLLSHRKISTQLSDPPPSLSRSQSPRPSIASTRSGSDRRSIEREAIRIVIDDVDCSSNSMSQPVVTTSVTPTSSTVIACLFRDPNYSVGHGFTAGFGLSLISRKNVLINWVDPHGPADRAGLRSGDIVLSWDGVQLVGRNFEDIKDELQHSGDSIQIQVLRNAHLDDVAHSQQKSQHDEHQQPLRPNKLTSSVLILDGSSGRSTPPSPTRRRLPQAPTVAPVKAGPLSSIVYRVQLKFKCNVERSGNVCMVITVLGADKASLTTKQSHELEENNEENSFLWIQMVLTPPSGASRKFVTDRIETTYGLRWNSFFTCSDMTTEEVSRSQLTLSLWADYFQRGETKLAESDMELQNITMDARPTWFTLRNCDSAILSCTPRRLSKALSHDQQNHQQQFYSRNSSELSVDHASQSPPSSHQRTPTPPGGIGLPRSRSAEICNLLLQPEAPGWATSGLSAPASLAPSRRGSSYNCDEDLLIPQSSPSSRRGSSVFADDSDVANMQLVHEKLSASPTQTSHLQHHGFSSSQRRSQSFRAEIKHQNRNSHDLPSNRTSERIINTSALELGAGQILPGRQTMGRDESMFNTTQSRGQIKIGLIITQGQLEVEVIGARNLSMIGENGVPPDTYVKATLCDQEQVFSKRKTRTMRQTCHPEFHQTLLFEACNAIGATLIIEVRLKDGIGSGKSIRRSSAVSPTRTKTKHQSPQQSQSTLGLVHIALDRLTLTTLTISWYRLIPACLVNMTDHFYMSDDSP